MTQLLTRSSLLAAAALALSLPAFASSSHDGDHGRSDSDSHGRSDDSHGRSDSDSHGDSDDDVACPCFTERDLKRMFDSGDQCYDYTATATYGNGTYLAYYDGEGMEAGVADYYYAPVPFCAAVNLTTFAGPFVAPITEDQYAACADIVLDVAEDLGLTCIAHP